MRWCAVRDACDELVGLILTVLHFLASSAFTQAVDHFTEWTDNHEIAVQVFRGFGSDWIKKAGYSPDAFVQQAIQIATHRLWHEQVGTYESTQVRPFLHGRTETTRSVSTESAALVARMGLRARYDDVNDESARRDKIRLLQEAVNSHGKYISNAAQGYGVDRHMLGLMLLCKEGEALPSLYGNPVFQRSKRWRVSTSHLTHPYFENWGYGEGMCVVGGIGES
jgi:carnitine O-acetyltransferase